MPGQYGARRGPWQAGVPPERAQRREEERHRLERDLGRTPAGEEGALRDTRSRKVSRQELDQAAAEADRRVAGHEMPKGQ